MGPFDRDELTPEEAEIFQLLDVSDRQIEELERQYKAIPSDTPLQPRPEGYGVTRPTGTKEMEQRHLQNRISQAKTETNEKIGKVLEKLSPEAREGAGQKIQQRAIEKARTQKKDIDRSQDFASKLKEQEGLKQPTPTAKSNAETLSPDVSTDDKELTTNEEGRDVTPQDAKQTDIQPEIGSPSIDHAEINQSYDYTLKFGYTSWLNNPSPNNLPIKTDIGKGINPPGEDD
jgi:hypothetical protein